MVLYLSVYVSKYSYLAPAIEIKVYRKSFLLSHAHMNVQHFTSYAFSYFFLSDNCVFCLTLQYLNVCVCATSSFDRIGWNKTKYNLIKSIPSTHSHGNTILCTALKFINSFYFVENIFDVRWLWALLSRSKNRLIMNF